MKLISLSILIPAYNVDDSIASVVEQAWKVGEKLSKKLEIIVIDDGSTDRTNTVLRRLEPSIPHLRILNHETNKGYGETIKELYYLGKNDWLFSLPGDNQYDARELTKLAAYMDRADMILGIRLDRQDPPSRILQSKIYNTLLKLLFGLNLRDVNTIRLMKRSMLQSLTLHSRSAFVDAELAVRACDAGHTIHEVSVVHKKRKQKGATGGSMLKTILPTIFEMLQLFFTR